MCTEIKMWSSDFITLLFIFQYNKSMAHIVVMHPHVLKDHPSLQIFQKDKKDEGQIEENEVDWD